MFLFFDYMTKMIKSVFNLNIFYSAIITVVYLKAIFKQENDENWTAQIWFPLENMFILA